MTRDWDAATYDRVSGPQVEWARAVLEQPFAPYLAGWQGPWKFAGAEETAQRLERAGFSAVDTWLEPYPVTPSDPSGFLRTVCLGHHLEQLPEELRGPYVEAVRERCGPELDHVRLNISAQNPVGS